MFQGFVQLLDGLGVPGLDRVHDAVVDMVLQNNIAGAVDGGTDRGQLDQNFGAVPALLDHGLDRSEMTDGPGETVDYRLSVFVGVGMIMTNFFISYGHRASPCSQNLYLYFNT